MVRTFELPYDKVSSKGKIPGLVWVDIQWSHFGKGQIQQNTSSRDVWRSIEVQLVGNFSFCSKPTDVPH